MVLIGNEVLTKIKTTITEATVLSPEQDVSSSFPCITFREISNSTNGSDSAGEHDSNISFEINIFTTGKTRISDSQSLIVKVDNIMSGFYGMTRYDSSPVENYADTNLYRHVMRYSCVVNKNKEIYRR